MPLKAIVDSLEGVEEAHRPLYKERPDGQFELDLEGTPTGFVEKKRLDEFRDRNVALLKERDALKEEQDSNADKLKRMDDLEKQMQDAEDRKMLADGRIDDLVGKKVERRVDGMRKEFDGKLSAKDILIEELTKTQRETENQLSTLLIDHAISSAASEVGSIRQGALFDVQARARHVFAVKDGTLVAMEGDQIRYGKDGSNPLSPKEWMTSLLETAPHLFEDSKGGNARGNNRPSGSNSNVKSIGSRDYLGFGRNLEAIAKGEVDVRRE